MSRLYLTNTEASLTDGYWFNKIISDSYGTTDYIALSAGKEEYDVGYGYSEVGLLDLTTGTGDVMVAVYVTTGDADGDLRVRVTRIDENGNAQESTSWSSYQQTDAGQLTFSFSNVDFTGAADTDRLRVDYEFGTGTHDAAIEIQVDSEYTWVDHPWAYTLDISADTGGTTDPEPGTYDYLPDTETQIEAIPDDHKTFDYWDIDGETVTENPTTVTMDSDKTATAYFTDADQYTLTIIAEGDGTTDPEPGDYLYYEAEEVTVTGLPNDGQRVTQWVLEGANTYQGLDGETTRFDMPSEDTTLTTYFGDEEGYDLFRSDGNQDTWRYIESVEYEEDVAKTIDDHDDFTDGQTYYYRARQAEGYSYSDWSTEESVAYSGTTGTIYYKTVTASGTVVTDLPRFVSRSALAFDTSITSISRAIDRIIAGNHTVSGNITRLKSLSKQLITGVSSIGSTVRSIGQYLTTSSILNGNITRNISNNISAKLNTVSNIPRYIRKITVGQTNSLVNIVRDIYQTIGASVSLTGAIKKTKLFPKLLFAASTITAYSKRKINRQVIASTDLLGSLRRRVGKQLSGSSEHITAIPRALNRMVNSSVQMVSNIIKHPFKNIQTSHITQSDITRLIDKKINAAIDSSGNVYRKIAYSIKALSQTVSSVVSDFDVVLSKILIASSSAYSMVTRKMTKFSLANIGAVTSIGRGISRSVSAAIFGIGSIVRYKTLLKSIKAYTAVSVDIGRHIVRLIIALPYITGVVSRRISRQVNAAVYSVGTLSVSWDTLVKKLLTASSESLSMSRRTVRRNISALVKGISSSVRVVYRYISVNIISTGTVSRFIATYYKATTNIVTTIPRTISHGLIARIDSLVTIGRAVSKNMLGNLLSDSQISRSLFRQIAAQLSSTGTLTKRVSIYTKAFVQSISSIVANWETIVSKLLTATVQVNSDITRNIGKVIHSYNLTAVNITRSVTHYILSNLSVTGWVDRAAIRIKTLLASMESNSSILRTIKKIILPAVIVTGTISRSISRAIYAELTSNGVIYRHINKAIKSFATSIGAILFGRYTAPLWLPDFSGVVRKIGIFSGQVTTSDDLVSQVEETDNLTDIVNTSDNLTSQVKTSDNLEGRVKR